MELPIQDYHVHSRYSDGEGTFEQLIEESKRSGCMNIAFTDHCSESGRFMYTLRGSNGFSLKDYLIEIKKLKQEHLNTDDVRVFAGLEISNYTSDYKFNFRDGILPYISLIDILLIDGWYVDDPVACARITRDVLEREGIKNVPVFIAHPYFADITENNIFLLNKKGIGLELNESKFRRKDREELKRIIQLHENLNVSLPSFTLGSDAHEIKDVGKVKIVHDVAVENGLESSIYWLK
ncbi:MAG: PHP domain-containing protein [Promethearchaeota archaeon]